MTTLSANLQALTRYANNIKKATSMVVKVGLPKEKVGHKIYGNGKTVLEIGAIHEYGLGNNPVRSFLRVPFLKKEDKISDFIKKQFNDVFQGVDSKKALGLIGVYTMNISKDAFTNSGFGEWPAILQSTIDAKGGKTLTLVDTANLKNSITWVIADA